MGNRKPDKKNVMAWYSPSELALLKQTAANLGVNMTQLIKMSVLYASKHPDEIALMKKELEDEKDRN